MPNAGEGVFIFLGKKSEDFITKLGGETFDFYLPINADTTSNLARYSLFLVQYRIL